MSGIIWLLSFALFATACGSGKKSPEPNVTIKKTAPRAPRSSPIIQDTARDKGDEEEKDPSEPPASEVVPAPEKLPLRTTVSRAEITTARDDYIAQCSSCHGSISTSEKRRVGLQRINDAGVAGAVRSHRELVDAGKWPKDVRDTKDDGIDQAILKASAMAEILK